MEAETRVLAKAAQATQCSKLATHSQQAMRYLAIDQLAAYLETEPWRWLAIRFRLHP